MTKDSLNNLSERLSDEEENLEINQLSQLALKIRQLKHQLNISDNITQDVKQRIEDSFERAQSNIQLIGGSEDDLAKVWGYNFGAVLFEYLSQKDSNESKQALSFIKMQLGFELHNRIGSELQFSSFVLGIGLRFMKGFEDLKQSLIDLENALGKFEKHEYGRSDQVGEKDLFGRNRLNSKK